MKKNAIWAGLAASFLILAGTASAGAAESGIPKYDHIFVIIEENHGAHQIFGNAAAPTFNRLAKSYGVASNFYAVTHPSEPNYIALLAGDFFGIADDDAVYCRKGLKAEGCEDTDAAAYPDHTRKEPSLPERLEAKGLTWKGYFEDLPAPGSMVYAAGKPKGLYASKHNGFLNFKHVQNDPERSRKIVGFDVLVRDIKTGKLPNFAHIVPNQCNDMHGLSGLGVPLDCQKLNQPGLIGRADRTLEKIVSAIMGSPFWKEPGNSAIVVAFDENDSKDGGGRPAACCGEGPHNPGGGWIPLIVITNHGPRGIKDPTPYNHYSLLRSIEDAFRLSGHLGHAADVEKGVVSMTPLFRTGEK